MTKYSCKTSLKALKFQIVILMRLLTENKVTFSFEINSEYILLSRDYFVKNLEKSMWLNLMNKVKETLLLKKKNPNVLTYWL